MDGVKVCDWRVPRARPTSAQRCSMDHRVALGNRGMTVEAAFQCAEDRKEWRALVHM